LPDILKKFQQRCQAFVKKSGKVGENFQKSSMMLPVFSKNFAKVTEHSKKKFLPTIKHSPKLHHPPEVPPRITPDFKKYAHSEPHIMPFAALYLRSGSLCNSDRKSACQA